MTTRPAKIGAIGSLSEMLSGSGYSGTARDALSKISTSQVRLFYPTPAFGKLHLNYCRRETRRGASDLYFSRYPSSRVLPALLFTHGAVRLLQIAVIKVASFRPGRGTHSTNSWRTPNPPTLDFDIRSMISNSRR